jgi:D-proline reductase (dithiol) PrdB
VPVLARVIEEAGVPTVTVTMMPDLAAKFRLSRIVGVEFPFGHAFGLPNDVQMQRTVCEAALKLLDEAAVPESRLDVDIEWPIESAVAYRDWQPAQPSPIVAYNMQRRQALEGERQGRS